MENKEKIEIQFKTDVNEEIKKNEFIQSVKRITNSNEEIAVFLKKMGNEDLNLKDSLVVFQENIEKLKDENPYKNQLLAHIEKTKDINLRFNDVVEKIKNLMNEDKEGYERDLDASIRELHRQKVSIMKELTNGVDIGANMAIIKPQAMQRALEGEDMDVILENEVYLKTENNMNFAHYQMKKDQEEDKIQDLKESRENREDLKLYQENTNKKLQEMEERKVLQSQNKENLEDPNKEFELEAQRRKFS